MMFGFWRHRKNRKHQRRYVLDVRLRARQTRDSWIRVVTMSLGVALVGSALLVGFVKGCRWLLDEWLFKHPAFVINQLSIDTGDLFPREWVRAWSGVYQGQNLMDLDLDRVKRNIEREPLVAAVALQRVPPETLRIWVRPRVPVAEIQRHEPRPEGGIELVSYYVDEEGYVLRFVPTEEAVLRQRLIRPGLPQLTGVPPHVVVAGLRLRGPNVDTALALAQSFGNSPMSGLEELAALDLGRPGVVAAWTARGSRITFGLRDTARPLARWRRVHDYAASRGQEIKTLDLSLTNNVPAVLRQRDAAQRAAPLRNGLSTPRRANA